MIESKSASDEPYIYTPLPSPSSIRLLHRLRRADDGLLNFSLETVDLRDQPKYHCLSYTWGNPHANGVPFRNDFEAVAPEYGVTKLINIRCNGRILKIRQNLYDALCEIPTDGWIFRILNRPDLNTKRIQLHDKAAEGSPVLVRAHIIQGANVHTRDCLGRIPLHYAALNGNLEAAKILLKAGSNIDAKDDAQKTAEDHAIENGHQEMADLLNSCVRDGVAAISREIPDFNENGPDARIWIDAICINQADLEERAAQVNLMNEVYSDAGYVIVWLGRKDQRTMTALDTIAKLVNSGDKLVKSNIVPYRFHPPSDYERAQLPHISQDDWDAVASLLFRQWFRRIWVIQEVFFARGIICYCGDTEVQWGDIESVTSLVTHRYRELGYQTSDIYTPLSEAVTSVEFYFQMLNDFRETRFQLDGPSDETITERFSLNRLIMATFPFFATDPRDKIFALSALSKLNRKARNLIQPNYSMPVECCYSQFSRLMMDLSEDLEVLSFVQDSSLKRIEQLPSWVPDYSLQATNPLPATHFSASRNLPFKPNTRQHSTPWNELALTGVEFDVIDRTADSRPLRGANRKCHLDPSWFSLLLTMDLNVKYHQTGQSLSEALWRTLCADQGLNAIHPAPLEFGEMFKTFLCAVICAEPERRAREGERNLENAINLGGLMSSALRISGTEASGPVGPDRDYMAAIRQRIASKNRSLDSTFFDNVRPTLSMLESLTKTAAGNYMPTSNDVEAYSMQSIDPIINSDGMILIPAMIAPFVHSHSSCYGRRRLFATRKGYLGLGPASIEVGDAVWIFPGAKVPFVLRPVASPQFENTASEPSRFKLVGEAYVHGIMHGEGSTDDECNIKLREISLI